MSDKDFKVMVKKILTKLEKRVENFNKNFNKEITNVKKSQLERKNSVTEIKTH